jgi:hypothetical protein
MSWIFCTIFLLSIVLFHFEKKTTNMACSTPQDLDLLTHPQAPWWIQLWVQGEDNGRRRNSGAFPGSQHFEGRRAGWSSEMGLGKQQAIQLFMRTYTNQTTSWLVHSWSTFGARMNHKQTQTHKTHHGPDLEESHHLFHYSIFYAWPRDQHPNVILSQKSQMGVSKFSKLGLTQLWGPITLCSNLWLKWGLKKSYSPCRELSNDMWHANCMQGNQGDSRILMVKSQIVNLIIGPSFGHNLCFIHPNGSYEPILDI